MNGHSHGARLMPAPSLSHCAPMEQDRADAGPWNPGLRSQIPRELMPSVSMLKPENIFQPFDEIEELSAFTGLAPEEIAAFRPQRLVVHELLIRVSANYAIPDGDRYEELGFNFRRMASTLLHNHLQPEMPSIVERYAALEREVRERVDREIDCLYIKVPPEAPVRPGWWDRLRGRRPAVPQPLPPEISEALIVERWRKASLREDADPLQACIHQCLTRTCGAIMVRSGRLRCDREVLARLVTHQVCNIRGSQLIGELIEPVIQRGAAIEGYRQLPIQPSPLVMNVKGASASGKSSLRPLQQRLAASLGLHWGDFALISPDIWRKFLLDYKSLGPGYKYAGALTSEELKIVDQKLDSYMAGKARDSGMPHLLIDRFRFDSFSRTSDTEGSNLLTRFGARVFMFYMITPPHITVERAWTRGLKVGRYKAVYDLLDHNVEAYTGMPHIFFTWALNKEKDVHYEFLDNSVPRGELPRTVAFGSNGSLNILDIDCMMDIDRYRRINIRATGPETVYSQARGQGTGQDLGFVAECIRRLDRVNFIDYGSRRTAASIESGQLRYWHNDAMRCAIPTTTTRSALRGLLPGAAEATDSPPRVELDDRQNIGKPGIPTTVPAPLSTEPADVDRPAAAV